MRFSILLFGLLFLGFIPETGRCDASPKQEKNTVKVADFRRDVVPVLTKAGCNAGACHGSFQGRGGFRLSLLGFDPLADYDALVREGRGRRVFPGAPEQSLILLKPTMAVAHGGKRKLMVGSPGYRILRDWIAQGMMGPKETDPELLQILATPSEYTLDSKRQGGLLVRAVWSDGTRRDVTSWALYESTNDGVAEVAPDGKVLAKGPGRAAVTVRYQGQVAAVPVTVPHPSKGDYPRLSRNNFIDDGIIAEWKKLGLRPAPLAGDAEFLRRVYLDLIGTLPTPREVQDFLASKKDTKRAKVIDELLERPEYVDTWALKWSDLLRAHRRSLGEKGLRSFSGWLREGLRDNRPVKRMVRELLTARGNLFTNGPVAFYFIDQTAEDLAETTAQLFLGVRLQCAKCHHHPFEVWSQEDYYGLAAFFAQLERKDSKDNGTFGGSKSVALGGKGVVNHPITGKAVPPRTLGREVILKKGQDPREVLADWVTSKDNPYFAKNIVNRYWGYLFGRGLVDPIDDLRATNPASHPALLDALAKDFVEHNYDLKRLLRTICNSRAYHLASEVAPRRDPDGMFFTHRRPRRLQAEVLLDAINQATMSEEKFTGLPDGTRAVALPDTTIASYFLDIFGRPKRTTTCECERSNEPDLSQVLHLANSEAVHAKVTAATGRVARHLAQKKTDAEIVENLYLATVSRPPIAREREIVRQLLAAAPLRKEGLEDLLWTLLNMSEFVCNH